MVNGTHNLWMHVIFEGLDYKPRAESLQDILHHTKPEGKRVLSVASWGYPLAFLSEGAKEVVGFEVHPGYVAWNHFLKASILSLDYEESLELFSKGVKGEKLAGMQRRISEYIPPHKLDDTLEQMDEFCWQKRTGRLEGVESNYIHLRDKATYDRVKRSVEKGAWSIVEKELLALLDELSERDDKFDVAYISSIRNWVLINIFGQDRQRFHEEYDVNLSGSISHLLNQKGIVYEFLIDQSGFIAQPMPLETYPNFEITTVETRIGFRVPRTRLAIGRKI